MAILSLYSGADQPIDLVMLDLPFAEAALGGVVMELQDCAFPLVNSLTATCDQTAAFTDIDVAVLVGAFPRRPGMERKDMLEKNAEIFQAQGKLLDTVAKKTVKVLVVGNPANTNALIASACAPSIPKENFSALTRLDQNRATSQIAMKSGVTANCVDVSIHRLNMKRKLNLYLRKSPSGVITLQLNTQMHGKQLLMVNQQQNVSMMMLGSRAISLPLSR